MDLKKVKALSISKPKTVSELVSEMAATGYQGRRLAEAVEVWKRMIEDPETTILLGYAGSLSTAGQWKLISWLIENRFIDVLVATGANLSEDLVEAMGRSYYQGSHLADNARLFKDGLNRYYDIYGREDDYLEMTELIADFYLTLDKDGIYSSREIFYRFGRWLEEKKVDGIVTAAARNRVPIYCPAIADSPYGDAALISHRKGVLPKIDGIKDYVEFMRLGEKVKTTGVIYIGGGVPKDFIQLLAATSDLLYDDLRVPNREGRQQRSGTDESYYPHRYAIQVTTDSPQWGGLSGCTFEEAVSWGKEDPAGDLVQCYCDATIALPLIVHALAERVSSPRRGTDFSEIFSG